MRKAGHIGLQIWLKPKSDCIRTQESTLLVFQCRHVLGQDHIHPVYIDDGFFSKFGQGDAFCQFCDAEGKNK